MTAHPLDGAWSKLERAKAHVDAVTSALPESSEDGVYALPTRREYRPDVGAVLVVVESVPQLSEKLSLLVGDALHNFRSSLDLAWWQLAVKHLRRTPTDDEASSIQFPIRRPGREFDGGGYVHWVGREAVDVAKAMQPPKTWKPLEPDTGARPGPHFLPPPLGGLRYLSNIDKHRVLNVTYLMMDSLEIRNPGPEEYTDCVLDKTRTADGSGLIQLPPAGLRPEAGSEILRIYVHATGVNPDVDFNPKSTVAVAVEPGWRLWPLLESIGEAVTDIVGRFEPLLQARPALPAE